MTYRVEISRRAAKAVITLDKAARRRILTAVEALAGNPRPAGCKKLAGQESWRIRVGDYRVVYEIHDQVLLVLVVDIGHRREICLAPLRDSAGVRANCVCPGLVDTPSSRRSRAGLTPAERDALPPALAPADIAAAAMRFLADDTLAGRIMVCRGGEPRRLLPLVDWQTA